MAQPFRKTADTKWLLADAGIRTAELQPSHALRVANPNLEDDGWLYVEWYRPSASLLKEADYQKSIAPAPSKCLGFVTA